MAQIRPQPMSSASPYTAASLTAAPYTPTATQQAADANYAKLVPQAAQGNFTNIDAAGAANPQLVFGDNFQAGDVVNPNWVMNQMRGTPEGNTSQYITPQGVGVGGVAGNPTIAGAGNLAIPVPTTTTAPTPTRNNGPQTRPAPAAPLTNDLTGAPLVTPTNPAAPGVPAKNPFAGTNLGGPTTPPPQPGSVWSPEYGGWEPPGWNSVTGQTTANTKGLTPQQIAAGISIGPNGQYQTNVGRMLAPLTPDQMATLIAERTGPGSEWAQQQAGGGPAGGNMQGSLSPAQIAAQQAGAQPSGVPTQVPGKPVVPPTAQTAASNALVNNIKSANRPAPNLGGVPSTGLPPKASIPGALGGNHPASHLTPAQIQGILQKQPQLAQQIMALHQKGLV